jgi:hypothetical protein
MFDSLDEQIKADEHKSVSNQERYVRWLIVAVISILVFGGLYFGVHMLQGS